MSTDDVQVRDYAIIIIMHDAQRKSISCNYIALYVRCIGAYVKSFIVGSLSLAVTCYVTLAQLPFNDPSLSTYQCWIIVSFYFKYMDG